MGIDGRALGGDPTRNQRQHREAMARNSSPQPGSRQQGSGQGPVQAPRQGSQSSSRVDPRSQQQWDEGDWDHAAEADDKGGEQKIVREPLQQPQEEDPDDRDGIAEQHRWPPADEAVEGGDADHADRQHDAGKAPGGRGLQRMKAGIDQKGHDLRRDGVHAGNGWVFTSANGGWEYPLYLSLLTIVQVLLGEGAYALAPSKPLPVLSALSA